MKEVLGCIEGQYIKHKETHSGVKLDGCDYRYDIDVQLFMSV